MSFTAKVYKNFNGKEIDFDQLLRKFKKAVEKDDIMFEVKKREYFMTPKEKQKLKQKHNRIHK